MKRKTTLPQLGKTKTLLPKCRTILAKLSATALLVPALLASQNGQAQAPGNPKQNPFWLLSGNTTNLNTKHVGFKFYGNGSAYGIAQTTGPLINQYNQTATYVHNSMPNLNGNLGFYIASIGSANDPASGSVQVIRSDGHQIGYFTNNQGSNHQNFTYFAPDFLIVPLNNNCPNGPSGVTRQPGYVIVAYNSSGPSATIGSLYYGVAYPGTPGLSNDTYGPTMTPETNTGLNTFPEIQGRRATLAAPKPVIGRTQYIYMAAEKGIYKFVVNPNYLNTPGKGAVSTRINPSTGLPGDENFANIFPVPLSTPLNTSELEVSEDGSKLAWANMNSNTITVINLDPVTGEFAGTIPPITISGLSNNNNRINGLEFIPNSSGTGYSLYATAGVDGNSTDGLFRIDWNAGSGTYGTPWKVSNPFAHQVAQSQIELDYQGNMCMLAADKIVRVNPANNGNIAATTFATQNPSIYNNSGIRKLPRQIDGWNYNVSGLIYGPHTVQVSGSGAAPSQTYSAPQLPGATYYWSYTTPGGQTTNLAGTSFNSLTISFPPTPLGTYILSVRVEHNDVCQTQSTTNFNVTTNNGSIPPPDGRIASPGTGVQMYPNPASGSVELFLPALEEVAAITITDITGKSCKTFTSKEQQQVVDISNLKNGIYFLHVQSGKNISTQKLVIVN